MTTDFGLSDEFVGVMKGVIFSRAPGVRIVDLSHGIGYQDISHAAYVIDSAQKFFPPGTVHTVVVDPGVGTGRHIIALAANGQYYLAPDNGVLTLVLDGAKENVTAHRVARDDLYLHPVSNTFHGRDIFAPVAAALAAGEDAGSMGPEIPVSHLVRLELPRAELDEQNHRIRGTVIRIDHFGNLITNIDLRTFRTVCPAEQDKDVTITVKEQKISRINTAYSQSADGVLAIFGSHDYLEIAVNKGSAAGQLQVGVGERVTVFWDREKEQLYK